MKRILFSLFLAAAGLSASAMNARDAREYAYFLTDKMAYELNLTPMQYERVYEVNLDYFLAVSSPYDMDRYQDYRDEDLRYILSDRQYWDYRNAQYFYRPLSWGRGAWVVNVYSRYNYRDDYYFGRPSCYATYQGTNWNLRRTGVRSPYWNVTFDFRLGGMRDSYARYYNTNTYVQPYQREPLIIVDGRYGGGMSFQVQDGRYGGNNSYYVSPSSSYYGSSERRYDNGANYYGSSSSGYRYDQGGGRYYDNGRRGNVEYDRRDQPYNYGRNSDYNRSNNGGRSYHGNVQYGGGTSSQGGNSMNHGRDNSNYGGTNSGNVYSSGRRGSSVFSQPQRDTRANGAGASSSYGSGRNNNANGQGQSSSEGSERVVNGTTIVGGRR